MAAILNRRNRWLFEVVPGEPRYVNVINPMGLPIMHLHKDTAGMYMLMYETMLSKHGNKLANEFFQGFMYGCTHMMMYRDHYPKVELKRDPVTGYTHIKVTHIDGREETSKVGVSDVITPTSHDIDKHGRGN